MKDEVTFFHNNFIIQHLISELKAFFWHVMSHICISMPCNHGNGTPIDLHNPLHIGQCYAVCMNATKYVYI